MCPGRPAPSAAHEPDAARRPWRSARCGLAATGDTLSIVDPSGAFSRYHPGDSPFRVKGHVYRSFREYIDANVTGGYARALSGVADKATREFLGEDFLAASWYDVFPFVPLAETAATMAAAPYVSFIRRAARTQASRDMNGIYRAILHLASADMVVERLPRTASRYFEFARTEVTQLRPGLWENAVHNIPAYLFTTYSTITDEFIKVLFEAAGTRGFRTQTFQHERAGDAHGVPLVRYVRRLQWDA